MNRQANRLPEEAVLGKVKRNGTSLMCGWLAG